MKLIARIERLERLAAFGEPLKLTIAFTVEGPGKAAAG